MDSFIDTLWKIWTDLLDVMGIDCKFTLHRAFKKELNTFSDQSMIFEIECSFIHLNFFIVVVLSFHSVQPEPLLQPHITHQLSSPSTAPGRRGAGGLLVPLHVPGRLLLPAARRLWPLLLAGAGHAPYPVLPLHPAEV